MSGVLSLVGWSFLPDLVTGFLQSIWYGLTIRAGDPKPQAGSPRHAEHRRRIHITVVSLYLLYTIYEADYELMRAGSFFSDLGVPLDASERDVKSRFRRLAALYHPDKASGGGSADDVNAYFVHLKAAADTLTDTIRRFAYERFGPDVVGWQHCATVRDYVTHGMTALLPYYAAAAVGLWGLGLIGYLNWGRYERWLLLATMFLFEVHAVTRPGRPAVLERVINPLLSWSGYHPPYLVFQAIALVRKLCVTIYIGFSQIGPLLAVGNTRHGPAMPASKKGCREAVLRDRLDRLALLAASLDADATRLLETEMAPFARDEKAVGTLRAKVKEWLVQNTLRADPMVKDALERSLQKRRTDAAAGANGSS